MNNEVPISVWVLIVGMFSALPFIVVEDLSASQIDCYDALSNDLRQNHGLNHEEMVSKETDATCKAWFKKGQIYSDILEGKDK